MRKAFAVAAFIALGAVVGGCGVSVDANDGSNTIGLKPVAALTFGGQFNRYNDVWGYADPVTATYLVFLGGEDAVAIIDVIDPEHPEVLSVVDVPYHASNHDLAVYGQYLYIVTERGATFAPDTPPGLQIVDFRDPRNPVVTFDDSSFSTAHTIFVDEEAGRLYAAGSDRGVRILDLKEPARPADIGGYAGRYVHELYARNGLVYAAGIRDGEVEVLDVRDPSDVRVVSRVETPWGFPHSTWLTGDGRYLITADEAYSVDVVDEMPKARRLESGIAVYDVSAIRDAYDGEPEFVASFVQDEATVHQIYMRGDLLFASWYTEGVKMFDLSAPETPVVVAAQDTSGLDLRHPWFGGVWGLWPYDPRGKYVYGSDIEQGLVVLEIKGLDY